MKIAQIHAWGDSDVIKIDDVAVPQIKDNEVLVAVHAAGVNPIDWKVREGYFADFMKDCFPFAMGWDFSGTVVSVGAKANYYQVGDEVFGLIRFPDAAGCFAEYVAAPIDQISHKPANLDHVHTAGVALVSLTAWQALVETAQIKPGQKILIHAAAGGVGQMAVQLAKWKGATVIATGSSTTKELLQSLGVSQFINYQTEKFEDKIDSVDIVLDLVGGDYTARSIAVLKSSGKLICFTKPLTPEETQLAKEKNIDAQFTIVKPDGEQLHMITHLIDDGVLNIKVDKVFPFTQIKEALTLQQSGHCHGKVILKIK